MVIESRWGSPVTTGGLSAPFSADTCCPMLDRPWWFCTKTTRKVRIFAERQRLHGLLCIETFKQKSRVFGLFPAFFVIEMSLKPFLVKSLVLRSWFFSLFCVARKRWHVEPGELILNTAAETATSRFFGMSRLSRLLKNATHSTIYTWNILKLHEFLKRQSYKIRRFGTCKLSCNITLKKYV